jgi:hypothetical protein
VSALDDDMLGYATRVRERIASEGVTSRALAELMNHEPHAKLKIERRDGPELFRCTVFAGGLGFSGNTPGAAAEIALRHIKEATRA